MTHIEALKPCPFCGCSVEHLIVADPAGNPAHESWVLCNVCKASSGISSTIGKARDKWNTRAVIDTALKSGEHPTSEPVRVEEPNNLFKRLMKLGTPINTLIGAARSADGLKYHDVPQAWIDGMLAHAEEAKEAWDGIIVALVETATPNQVPYERRTENSTGARPNQVKVSVEEKR